VPDARWAAAGRRRLIVNADDYGKTREVSDAIREAATRGVVTSTTVMVNMPHAAAVAELTRERPGLGVGLHLNLTEGRPVARPAAVPSLVDRTGRLWPPGEFLRRAWLGRIRPEHLRAEIDAQLAALLELVGEVTHLDSHKHVHSRSPGVLRVALRVAAVRGVRRVRTSRRTFVASGERDGAGWRLRLRHLGGAPLGAPGLALAAIQSRVARRAGFGSPDAILTPYPPIAASAGAAARASWIRVAARAPRGIVEAVFHPGAGPRYAGQAELLCDPALAAGLADAGVELVSYAALEVPRERPSGGDASSALLRAARP
jgi:predicted glycoside hydrolase/deacetylase ChbG (UPF0249 family)